MQLLQLLRYTLLCEGLSDGKLQLQGHKGAGNYFSAEEYDMSLKVMATSMRPVGVAQRTSFLKIMHQSVMHLIVVG